MEELDFDEEVLLIHPDEDVKKIESIEIDANSNLEQVSDSDSGEIDDDEETNDLEDGEIKDINPFCKINEDIICRFFKRGSCAFGSQCKYRHISDKVYNMFEASPQRRNDVQHVEHHDFPKPIIFPPNVLPPRPFNQPPIPIAPKPAFHRECDTLEDNWERGLEQARILIQKANLKKQIENCESKKFISKNKDEKVKEQYFTKTNLGNELDFASKKYSEKALMNKSLKREDAGNEKKSSYRYQSKSMDKWVDPWRRSKSPLAKKRSFSGSPRSRSRKSSYASSTSSTSSSSSEIDDIYRRPYEKKSPRGQQRFVSRSRSISQPRPPKKRRLSPRHSFNRRRNSRSYSRSLSRSPCRKRTISPGTQSISTSSSCSESSKSPTIENNGVKRISAKLNEQLYQKSPKRASPLPDSDCETSELTVSSASCTPISSDSETESPHHSSSLKIKKKPIEINESFYSNKAKSFTNPKVFNKNQSDFSKNQDRIHRQDDATPAFHRKIQPYDNNNKMVITKNIKTEPTDSRSKNTAPYFSTVGYPSTASEIVKNKMSDDAELLLMHQDLRSFNKSNAQKVKPNNPAIKPSKTTDVIPAQRNISNSESFGNVSKPGNVRKQNIILNLQPKSKDTFKPEILYKHRVGNETATIKKETSSKREQLLNKLKLIDDAIARKKSSNAY